MFIHKDHRIPTMKGLLPSKCRSALDIGCGGLKNTIHEVLYGELPFDDILVVDTHEPNIQERADFYKEDSRYTFMHADAMKVNLDSTYDLITLIHVIEHLDADNAVVLLRKLNAACTGIVLVETPDQFEDGERTAAEEHNPHQRHRFLADEEFMSSNGYRKVFSYRQNQWFTNSVYAYTATPSKVVL